METTLSPPRANTSPFFLLSGERSGSTLLRYVLDTHPEVYCPDELYLAKMCGSLSLFFEGANGRMVTPKEKVSYALTSQSVHETRQVVDRTMDAALAARGRKVWCEKTPLNLNDLDILRLVFPDARYIGLHRHPLDFIRSALYACRFGFWPGLAPFVVRCPENLIDAMADAWIDKTSKLLAAEAISGDAFLRVRYEELICDPEATVGRIEKFLGVRHDATLLNRVFTTQHAHRVGFGDESARFSTQLYTNRLGQGRELPWRLGMSESRLAKVSDLMAQLGYPALPAEGSEYSLGVEPPQPSSARLIGSVRQYFEGQLPAFLAASRAALPPLEHSFRFRITGVEAGEWILDPDGFTLRTQGSSDTLITADSETFLAVLNGELSAMDAVVNGQLIAEGVRDPVEMQQMVGLMIHAAMAVGAAQQAAARQDGGSRAAQAA